MKWFCAFALLFWVNISEGQTAKKRARAAYVNHTEVGVMLGRVKYSPGYAASVSETKASFTAQMYNGLQLTRRLSAGATLGMDWYKNALITPLMAGARWELAGKFNARLYATADVGYGFAFLHQDSDGFKTKGGLSANPGIGMKYGKAGGNQFTISLSYKRQHVHVEKPLLWDYTVRYEDRVYNRVALRIGMSF